MKRSSQAIRTWRTGPLVWRSGPRTRRSRWAGSELLSDVLRVPVGLGRMVLASRRGRLILLSVLAASAVLGGAWLWFQDSSLVAVQQVTVTGVSGPDAGAVRSALVASARSMTTLDVQASRLYSAVSAYPVVRSLEVTTQFPHGMRIHVIEELPVADVVLGGRRIAVAGDGTLLHDLASAPALPTIDSAVPPGGPRLIDPRALQALAAARAAPTQLRSRVGLISVVSGRGLVARLVNGPIVYLGDTSQLRAKWDAAVAVLANPGSVGASYIDVTDPGRPAAGARTSSTSSGGGSGATGAGSSASTGAP